MPRRPSPRQPNQSGLHLLANTALQNNATTKRLVAKVKPYFDALDRFRKDPMAANRFMNGLWSTSPQARAKHLNIFAQIRTWAASKSRALEKYLFDAYDAAFLKRLQRQKH